MASSWRRAPTPNDGALAYLRETGLPCVLVDRTPDPSFDQVGVNNRDAMRELVDYVASLGHRRIGYIGGHPGFETTLERIVGYRDSLERLGLAFDERYLVTGNASTSSAAESAHALLSLIEPPTAIVTGNNMSTIGAMRAIRARDLPCPTTFQSPVSTISSGPIVSSRSSLSSPNLVKRSAGGRRSCSWSGSQRPRARGGPSASTPR